MQKRGRLVWGMVGALTIVAGSAVRADTVNWAVAGGAAVIDTGSGPVSLPLTQSTLEGVSGNGLFRAFTTGAAVFGGQYQLYTSDDTNLQLNTPSGTFSLSAWDVLFDAPANKFVMSDAQLVHLTSAGTAELAGHISFEFDLVVTNVQESDDPKPAEPAGDLPEICATPNTGPDVIVGELSDVSTYGNVNGIYGYAVGTTSCNLGNVTVNWQSGTNQHPVIGQNLYRYKLVNGASRMEQIGQSWLKHGFTALAGNVCCTCTNPGTGSLLGVGCSDPYVSSLNGNQSLLGPRSHVNAATGCYPYPFSSPNQAACGGGNNYITPPAAPATIGRRLQVPVDDLNPALNAGAIYFVEGQYISADDTAAGNDNNNASYRRANVGAAPSYLISLPATFMTQRQKGAIIAWQDTDPNVTIVNVDVPSDGRMTVGYSVTNTCGNVYHYEFAIYNMNSDRSAQSFTVPVPDTVAVNNIEFHDVAYHSGEPYAGTDWTVDRTNGMLSWSTQAFATNANANALRWGTTYNFRFDANSPPVASSTGTIGLFKPGTPTSVNVTIKAPGPVPAVPEIASSNPPTKCLNPFKFGTVYRDVLDTGTGSSLTAGIGAAGTASQGNVGYSPILVTFGAAPGTDPTAANTLISCTDANGNGNADCPTITDITSDSPGVYAITLSAGIPPRECVTIDFSAVAPNQKLQFQSLPGDVNLDGTVTTQDLLSLVLRVNDGTANLATNRARYNVNRSDETTDFVNTQDFLRVIQLLNGMNTTQAFNGVSVAACP